MTFGSSRDASRGKEEASKKTFPVNPPVLTSLITENRLEPTGNVIESGLADMAKSGTDGVASEEGLAMDEWTEACSAGMKMAMQTSTSAMAFLRNVEGNIIS